MQTTQGHKVSFKSPQLNQISKFPAKWLKFKPALLQSF
ncbi:hypothetical protein CCS77_0918 [Campylobacter concisus]|uniref:Uncharacterized protein n=1 Tax=Campylobacter concisus TaxID=199 RepID=A0A2R4NZX8_9BACT|nr:hypothetical protein CCS77_0918 [Campylobacter concisus]